MNILKTIIYNIIFIAVWLIPIGLAVNLENNYTDETNLQVAVAIYTAIIWYVMGMKIYPLFKIKEGDE